MTTSAEIPKGVDLQNLNPGSLIDMEPQNGASPRVCRGGPPMRLSGHPTFCPVPVLAELEGSVNREGAFETGYIRPGSQVVFLVNEHVPVTTSRVLSVHVDRAKSSPSVH
jgi:hypothetical protein